MKRRRTNPRLAKIHRNYTVEEVARLFGMHKGTVRQWIKQGLPTIDDRRPALVLGRELRAFLEKRRTAKKRPCAPGQLYCLKCRLPREPAGGLADCLISGPLLANLAGICPVCDSMMYRRVSLRKLDAALGPLRVTLPEGLSRIDETSSPSLNRDFEREAPRHANTQPE